MQTDLIYDEECFPNIWLIGLTDGVYRYQFEYSWRVDEIGLMLQFLSSKPRLIGFNNIGYDYPVLHFIIENYPHITPLDIYNKSMSIIDCDFDKRFSHIIWDDQRHIEQIDLFKIHHFDNKAKFTSLKIIEFNMRVDNVQELPFHSGTILDSQQMDILRDYMWNDVESTYKFYQESKPLIEFREELTSKYNRNFLNHNDTKIGKDYFIMRLAETDPTFDKRRQTPRQSIVVKDIVFPYIRFEQPEFTRILSWFKSQTITETKNAFSDINCAINGFDFHFGTGGIHGSVDSQIVSADDEYMILDVDVASYYPNIAIVNGLYPEHLGKQFCAIYKDVYEQRKQYKKGTVENAMLKLALNGVYGDSNNVYSAFYDPQYTMSITINGQLMLCMLAEELMVSQHIQMIQINTDGLTIRCPRSLKDWVLSVCQWWENVTRLELENVEYSRMFIRDVNNYIAEKTDGKLKRKGAYEYDRQWHQDQSALIVPKAAEAALVHGADIREFVEHHQDVYDFMLRTKVPRSSRLVLVDYHGNDKQIQNVSRYYISCLGGDLVKIMPPLKGKTEDRRIGINTGWKVTECNNIADCNPDDIEFEWYIAEAEKLVKPLMR